MLQLDTTWLADMLGQRSEGMALHDSHGADLQEKLRPAVEKMEDADKTRTDVSGKSGETVQSPEAPFGASVSSL